jgi:prepilin-type N-terminal cleavage/methylation domain-containing protein
MAAGTILTTGRNTNRGVHAPATGRRGPRRRADRAFTLLELIVVLGLVGVLLAMAAPSLRGFMGSRQTADAAAQVLALTQWAGSRAAAEGTIYRLNVDAQANTYWLTLQQGGEFVDLGSEFGRRFKLPEGTTATLRRPTGSEPRAYIEFYPNGRTEEVTMELRGRQGEVFRVVCESATEAFHIVSPSEASKS